MIYLITGVPGSGKSLYAVSKLLRDLLKEKVKREDGSEISRRLCVDGIPDLTLPHELMAPRREASLISRGKDEELDQAEGHGLWNWWQWCRPGDVIVVDEVQRYWRPRGMGTKVPEDIAKLETHRHYGVDFVLITQNPMLVDQNVRRLVGRHQHVRRLFGSARALIYDWDGCQTDTSRLAGATRTLFAYPKDAYKLYKSSELHTKQRQKVPLWFAFPLVVLAVGAVSAPKAYEAIKGGVTGKGVATAAASASSAPVAARSASASASGSFPVPRSPIGSTMPLAVERAKPKLSGCIAFKGRCECFGDDGMRLDMEPAACEDASQRVSALPLMVGHGAASRSAYKAPEDDCDVIHAGTGPEVRCGPKNGGPPAVVIGNAAPIQGIDQDSIGRSDATPSRGVRSGAPAPKPAR
jgi:zona occludens toxin